VARAAGLVAALAHAVAVRAVGAAATRLRRAPGLAGVEALALGDPADLPGGAARVILALGRHDGAAAAMLAAGVEGTDAQGLKQMWRRRAVAVVETGDGAVGRVLGAGAVI